MEREGRVAGLLEHEVLAQGTASFLQASDELPGALNGESLELEARYA